jgi:hypothetical protein
MDTRIAAVVLAVAVAGGGYAGWRLYGELGKLRVELAATKSELEKSRTEARVAKERTAEVTKELDEQKIFTTALRAERDSARLLMEATQRHNERMQQELQLAMQQVAYLRARAGGGGMPAQMTPQLAPQRAPMIIQAIPAPRPQGAAVAAPVPGQGYGPR